MSDIIGYGLITLAIVFAVVVVYMVQSSKAPSLIDTARLNWIESEEPTLTFHRDEWCITSEGKLVARDADLRDALDKAMGIGALTKNSQPMKAQHAV